MLYYTIKRIIAIILSLFFVVTLTFFIMHAIPGDPFASEKSLSPDVAKAVMAKYHLDKPLSQQYLDYLGNLCRLDFGVSLKYQGRTVNEMLREGFPASGTVGLLAILAVLAIGIPCGVVSAVYHHKIPDYLLTFLTTIGVTIPSFILATILLYIFGLKLSVLPIMGLESWKGYILPVITLACSAAAAITRLTKSSMVEVLQMDYIQTARAKGLSEPAVWLKHGLRNGLIPVMTVLGPMVANMLTGSFVVEKIFAIPGIGGYFVNSISDRDYTTIMGITIFYAVIMLVMTLVVDIASALVDPKIKFYKH